MKVRLILTALAVVAIVGTFLSGYAAAGFTGNVLPGVATPGPSPELLDEASGEFDIFWEAWDRLQETHYEGPQNVVDLVLGHRLGDAWTVGVTTDRLIDGEDIGLMRGRAIGHDGLLVFVKNTTAGVEKSCLLAREERGRSSAAIEPKASH